MNIFDKLAELGFSWPTLVAQIVNFIVLLVMLYFFAYKPVMKMLDQRAQKIKDSLDETQKIKDQAAVAEQDFKKRLEVASKEGQEVIARAMRSGEEARQRAQQEAKVEAQAVVEKARQEIQHERDEAIGELRQEFADLTIVAAEKVITKSLNKNDHQKLIEQVLAESTTLNKKA
ncbi:MAG: F0F1 ATP synthase subunit B [Dehalococcoidales bacterium]|nr:F0F1 ATP synthase subunit B [Dehalococcoidales bacterium]